MKIDKASDVTLDFNKIIPKKIKVESLNSNKQD